MVKHMERKNRRMVTLRQRLLQGHVGYGIEDWAGDYIRHNVELKRTPKLRRYRRRCWLQHCVMCIGAIVMTTVIGELSLNTCSLSILPQSKCHGKKMPGVS